MKDIIPHIWPTKKLGEVCDIYQPKTITSEQIKKEGPYKVFGANGIIGYYDKYNHEDSEVLVTCRGATCGTVNLSEPKSWVTGNAMVVHPKVNDLAKIFLYYVLKNSDLRCTVTGAAQPQITRISLSQFRIPFPSLKIQHQIVERLDAIKKTQKLNNKQVTLADELFRSLLHKELDSRGKTWELKKIGDIAGVTSSKRIFQSEYITDGIPFYRTKEIVELSQNKPISLELFISEERFDEINKKFGVPQKSDILISAVGTIGVSWIVPDRRKFYFKDGNLLWIKNFNDIDSYYLKLVLDNIFKSISELAAGAAYNALTIIKLKKIKISVPPLKTQREIVQKLQAVQDYKKTLLEQKQKLQELFDSCLNKMMNGEYV